MLKEPSTTQPQLHRSGYCWRYLQKIMTIIISLGNNDQMIQISDRRLSANGEMIEEESNKAGILVCNNARMTFGYTGLAKYGKFSTIKWLLKSLHESATPDYTIGEMIERLKVTATETFKNQPDLRFANKQHKKLAVMFSGYLNIDGSFKQGCAILSNYHDFKTNNAFSIAQDDFQVNYSSATKGVEWPTLVQRVGNWRAMTNGHIEELREFLIQKKPPEAVIGKTIELIKKMSDSPKSAGSIGKQLMCVTIPRDLNSNIECSYYSNYAKPETFFPAIVYAMPSQHMVVENISVQPVESTTPPLSVPKVSKNTPCPCGSLKKYKHCHGKKKRIKR